MLIRLMGHYVNNPNHIDKLIAIKGLPNEWIFRKSSLYDGNELIQPWEPDVESNIPKDIRHLCEPMDIIRVFPPIEKGREYVVDRKTILGLRFDFMTQPGQDMWDKIERYLDRMTPRDQKVPVPVLVAPNHLSAFNPHTARRTPRGSLEFFTCEIPEVDLRIIPATTVAFSTGSSAPAVVLPPDVAPQPEVLSFPCDKCPKAFTKERALKMHTMKMHKKVKEPAGV